MVGWNAFVAPAQRLKPVIAKLNAAPNAALTEPDHSPQDRRPRRDPASA
jgi:hypothetical protein